MCMHHSLTYKKFNFKKQKRYYCNVIEYSAQSTMHTHDQGSKELFGASPQASKSKQGPCLIHIPHANTYLNIRAFIIPWLTRLIQLVFHACFYYLLILIIFLQFQILGYM